MGCGLANCSRENYLSKVYEIKCHAKISKHVLKSDSLVSTIAINIVLKIFIK